MLISKRFARIIAYESEMPKVIAFLSSLPDEEKCRPWRQETLKEGEDQLKYLEEHPNPNEEYQEPGE